MPIKQHATSLKAIASEFAIFGLKEFRSCVFAGPFLAMLALSSRLHIAHLDRYDALFLGAILVQVVLIALKLENLREVLVLSAFHALGMGLELFKTSPGVASWSYPEPAFFKIRTVPLYSGFMYASVASYMMQAWRQFDLTLQRFPTPAVCFAVSAAIYANFFTERAIGDLRIPLAIVVLIVFRRTWVHFTVTGPRRRMPLLLAFGLIGFFVWIAENIATFFGA